MPQWTSESRNEGKCAEVLAQNDAHSLERRAARLAKFPTVTTYVQSSDMPDWVNHLLSEAIGCIVAGFFNAGVAVLTMAAEFGIRSILGLSQGQLGLTELAQTRTQVRLCLRCIIERLNRVGQSSECPYPWAFR